jgi:hypothetical protein
MPIAYLKSAANDALDPAWCLRPWLSTTAMQAAVSARHFPTIFQGGGWTATTRRAYDKMLTAQRRSGGSSSRAEDPLDPGFVHRLSLAYTSDTRLSTDGRVLAALLGCERLSDYAGQSAVALGGTSARAEFRAVYKETEEAWSLCSSGIRAGQTLSSVAAGAFAAQINLLMERRYDRLVRLLSAGPPRDEILANTHSQISEIADYIRDFDTDLMRRASKISYAEQPRFVGERFLTAYTACMTSFLDSATGPVPGGVSLPDLLAYGSGGANGPLAARTPAPTAVKHLPPPASPQPAPALALQHTPMGPQQPPPPYVSWPPFAPPPPFSFGAPPASGGFGGGGHGTPFSPPSQSSSASSTPAPQPKAKPEPLTGKAAARRAAGHPFCAQPHHAWTAGSDLANQPLIGGPRAPECKCGLRGIPGYVPGQHATWDCPLRFVKVFGFCPGFLPSGHRDLAQWQGDCLNRAGRDAWAALIESEEIPLPAGDFARAPNFRA